MKRVRLLLADDHALVVEGLRKLLEPRHQVVGVAHNGPEVLRLVGQVAAECLLLDLSMPGGNGLDLIGPIRDLAPGLKIVIVTMFVDKVLADAAILAGADGFVPKDAGIGELEAAISEVMAGRRYVARAALRRVPPALAEPGLGLLQLTPRQRDIVRMVGEGKSLAEIAEATGLSERTISFHKTNIRRSLGIPNETAFLRYAMMVRLTGPDTPVPDDDQ